MSLVLIVLVGILLVGLARHSLLIAAETREAKSDLQRRWGTVFLSRALLSDPEPLVPDISTRKRLSGGSSPFASRCSSVN